MKNVIKDDLIRRSKIFYKKILQYFMSAFNTGTNKKGNIKIVAVFQLESLLT